MRVNVYVPDELARTLREQLPDVNVSATLQTALRALLACSHASVVCRDCAAPIDTRELIDLALGAFFRDAMWRIGELVYVVGTAEGAARVLKDVAERHRVPAASGYVLPRPSRSALAAAKAGELDTVIARRAPRPDAGSRSRHPSATPTRGRKSA